jgi:hypothetical protein
MRWEALFADLEARIDTLSAAEREAEIVDRTRYEIGRFELTDRLRPAVGARLRLSCQGGLTLIGRLDRVHREWLLLDDGAGGEALIVLSAVMSVGGLSRMSASPGTMSAVDARFGLRLALRGIARDRSAVRLHLIDGTVLNGTLDRAGNDFVELALHPVGEPRRRSAVSQSVVVATGAVAALRREV